MALCLDFKYRSALVPFLAMIPIRAGVRHKRGLFLSHPIDSIFEDDKYHPYNLAEVLFRSLGMKLTGDLSKLYLPRPTEQQIQNVDSLLNGVDNFIAISPYSSDPRKDWPDENYSQIIMSLSEKYRVLILGSAKDMGKTAFKNAIDMTGKTSLLEMSEIIRRSKLFIGGCSGPLHIASAVGAPIVAIYTATSPEQWAPKQNTTVLYDKQACSPCINKGIVCKHFNCVNSVSVDEVLNACWGRLQKSE